MTAIRTSLLTAVCAMALGCTGDAGPPGDPGPAGPTGPEGPEGPLATAPVLTSVSPSWGSGNTQVTITGQNFSTTAIDNQVYFDGYPATVISATDTQLVVTADVASDEGQTPMVVSVEVGNQVSNGLFFNLVPSGTAGVLDVPLPTAPTSVVELDGELYIAAGMSGQGSRTAGLYRMSGNQVGDQVSRLFAADSIEASDGMGGTFTLPDGPVALTTDGTDVYFTTALGSVRRYEPATGQVIEILGPSLGGGPAFPGRTGLVIDDNGVIFVVDRNIDQGGDFGGIIWIDPSDWSFGSIVDIGFAGSGDSGGIYGIATDGSDLWVTNEYWGEVYRVTDPLGSATVDLVADGAWELRGIALIDDDTTAGLDTVVASENPFDPDSDPRLLWSADMTATSASLVAWGDDVGGYLYTATGMTTTAAGDLLLAQPDGSVVRSIAAGTTSSTILAAGMRSAFAAADGGSTWYLATFGPALFGGSGGPSPDQPDGAVLEVQANGATRVLAVAPLFAGLVISGTDQLTVSDCFGQRIFTIDVTNGDQVNRLDESDGIGCPAGLAIAGNGDLFFADIDLADSSTQISRLSASDALTPGHVTGLQDFALFLALAGDTLLSSGFGPFPFAIDSASATSGGVATELVPAVVAGQVGIAAAPDGRAFAFRFGTGSILEIDTTTGDLLPYGSALAPDTVLGPGGGSFAFAAAFEADGTMVLADSGQGALIAVTP